MRADRLHARLLRAAVLVASGMGCVGLGLVLFPGGNLAGGLGILGGLLSGVGVLMAVIALVAWAVELGTRRDEGS